MMLDGATRLRKFSQHQIHIVVVTQMGHLGSSLALERRGTRSAYAACLAWQAKAACATVMLLTQNQGAGHLRV